MRDNVFKLLYALGVPSFLRLGKSKQITILSLHRISPERDLFFDPIDPIVFKQLLGYIKKHYEVISFNELPFRQNKSKKPLLILSFDDGYYDFYEYALPILRGYDLVSNHNIVNTCASFNTVIWTQRFNYLFSFAKNKNTDLVIEIEGDTYKISDFQNNWLIFNLEMFKRFLKLPEIVRIEKIDNLENKYSVKASYRMMNWDEIYDCSNNNVEIGSHTYSHNVLSTIEDKSVLLKEIHGSKKEIEEKIKKDVNVLALPNGQSSALVDTLVQESGFNYLLYVDDKTNLVKDSMNNSKFQVYNRINLLNENYAEMILRSELFHIKIRK